MVPPWSNCGRIVSVQVAFCGNYFHGVTGVTWKRGSINNHHRPTWRQLVVVVFCIVLTKGKYIVHKLMCSRVASRLWPTKMNRKRGKYNVWTEKLSLLGLFCDIFDGHLRLAGWRFIDFSDIPSILMLWIGAFLLLDFRNAKLCYPLSCRQNLEMIVSKLAKEKPTNGNIILVSFELNMLYKCDQGSQN